MKIKENEPLAKYTSFRMGGCARKLYFPENVEELQELAKSRKEILNYLIGGGSNLLINDKKEFDEVLCLRELNQSFDELGGGRYHIGASVRLQKAIKSVNEGGYGGMEYLYSVPGLVGGAIYMNAGKGEKYRQSISDYLVRVEVYRDGEIFRLDKEDCGFAYRSSAFQQMEGCVILGAEFLFPPVSQEESAARVRERIELCRRVQDMSAPNYGTVFCEHNRYLMEVVRRIRLGYKNGVSYSPKTRNWMLHGEEGTFEQAVALLEKVERWHKRIGSKCRTEVRIWE